MEVFTTEELKLIAEKRGIENNQNMSRKKLVRVLDKSRHNFKDITLKKPNRIAKMQNLSLDDLEQIERMNNLSLNKLKQNAKTRHIKTNKNTSKEELLIALLKSNQSHTEL